MAESVKVIVRCRPMNNREKDLRSKCVVFMDSDLCSCSIVNPNDNSAPPKSFTFDGVYGVGSTTEQIYNDIAYPLVEGVLEGYNSTVFAYGQTGCGKSFSMQGVVDPLSQRGIIPRAFEHIFEAISVAEGTKYLVHASYLEIYNEEIRDLLGKDAKKRLSLKEQADKGVFVQELSQHPVQNVRDCEHLMEVGWRNRATGATLMNADSSRSHSIFSISLEMMSSTLLEGDEDLQEHIRRGKLNLVDLAGSERQAKTGATGERLKEATKINLSLSALGNVISALVDGKSKHIPYRDSKLTRLLQDSLGGNTKTLMVGCISPADNNYDETLSTLRYANRAKNICNKPVINQDPKDTMLQQYQDEIKKLKELLESSGQTPIVINSQVEEKVLSEERESVRIEFEQKMERLRAEYEAEQDSKIRLQSDLEQLKQHYQQEMSRINEHANINNNNNNISGSGVKTPCELIVDQALNSDNVTISAAQQEVLLRLQKLQETMVGGERANDRELKEKRMKKKKASERRLQALAKVLAKVDDDEGVVLKVYDDINQELSLKTDALRKNRNKVRALEREISDLQSEFENERTDYLETIRRQNRQLKLYQQVTDKIVPTLRKECNYSNLERIKADAVWGDDAERWTLPELTVARTKLPPAGDPRQGRFTSSQTAPGRLQMSAGDSVESCPELCYCSQDSDSEQTDDGRALIKHCFLSSPYLGSGGIVALLPSSGDRSNRSSGSSGKSSHSPNSSPPSDRSTSPDAIEENRRRMLQKLQRSEREDIAGNYFKPKRAMELLNRAKQDASKAFSTWKDYSSSRNKSTGSTNGLCNALNGGLTSNGLHSSLNALNLNTSLNGSGYLTNSWAVSVNGGGWTGNGHSSSSPDCGVRRPVRLEALPTLERKPAHKRRNGKTELNTMDII